MDLSAPPDNRFNPQAASCGEETEEDWWQ